jgi:hypothetical protein
MWICDGDTQVPLPTNDLPFLSSIPAAYIVPELQYGADNNQARAAVRQTMLRNNITNYTLRKI